ncbi:hypothetical protein ACHAXA_004694 [Cyclostephanos tholiformis]|uniref:Uncharacterized protein n=1 Tax=Cyclostephanos tholiformis TaxID=382380 RepID=A0ABD3R1T5_9STRA
MTDAKCYARTRIARDIMWPPEASLTDPPPVAPLASSAHRVRVREMRDAGYWTWIAGDAPPRGAILEDGESSSDDI